MTCRSLNEPANNEPDLDLNEASRGLELGAYRGQ